MNSRIDLYQSSIVELVNMSQLLIFVYVAWNLISLLSGNSTAVRRILETFGLDIRKTLPDMSSGVIVLPGAIIKYVAALAYLSLSLTGLVLNLLWIGCLFAGHRYFSQRPFFIVSRHLTISNILCVVGCLTVAFPLTIMDYKTAFVFRRTFFFNYFATFETVGRCSTIIFILLQALSQIVPLVSNQNSLSHRLNSSESLICMLGWIVTIGMMTWFLISKCRKDFDLFYFTFSYECPRGQEETAKSMWTFIYILTIVAITVGLCIYGVGLRILQRGLKSNTTFTSVETNVEKKELGELKRVRLILIQGLSIILITLARTVASAVLPKLAENLSLDMRSLVNIINNCIELTSNSVHPLVYIIFSREAQKYAKKLILVLLRRKKAGTENTMDGILSDLNSTIIIS